MKLAPFTKIILIPLILFTVALVCGAVGSGMESAEDKELLTDYIGSFFAQVPSASKGLMLSALKKNILLWLLIFVSGFILPGFLLNLYMVIQRGYVIGYTIGGFCNVYGLKGIFACFSLLPEMVIYIPLCMLFSSISLKMSFLPHDNKKVFLKKYFVFSIIFLSVFCVVSFFQTFLTTTFMSAVSKIM